MKVTSAFIFCVVVAGSSPGRAQEVHDAKKDRAILDAYLNAQMTQAPAYFYGLYVGDYLSVLNTSDSVEIRKFLSTPNSGPGRRSILVARTSDLEQLNNLQDSVLIFGPRKMESFVRDYVPVPQPSRVVRKRRDLFSWINPFGFSPSRVAYGRWAVPYTLRAVDSNPNSLPYYMTGTNTNKYLVPSDK